MALTASQQAAYDTLVAQGRIEFANQFANAMTAVNAGVPVEQATQAAFSAPAPTPAPASAAVIPSPTPATAVSSGPSISDLYQQYLGRAPDAEGLQYWSNMFGSSIDPSEIATFRQAVDDARTAGIEPIPAASQVPAPVRPTEPEIKDFRGKTYDTQQLLSLAQQLAPTVDYENFWGGVYGTEKGNIGFAFEDSEKALGFTPSVLDQVLLDMSRHLLDEGITSLDQLEARDQFRRFGSTYTGEGGTIYEIKRDPATGQVTTQTWGKSTSDKGNILTAASLGLGLLGVPASLGGALNTGLNLGLNQAAQGALGGALLGGGTAALGGGDVLKGAVLGGLGGYAQGGGFSSGADMGLNSDLTMAQIESGLGTPGYGYGAQAAASGLFNPALIGSGAYLDLNGVPTAYAPDNIDAGGGWSPNLPDFEMTVTAPRPVNPPVDTVLPVADYRNEGRNYPTPISTQGSGGSPVNASVGGGVSLGNVIRAIDTGAKIAALTGAGNAIAGDNRTGFDVVPVPSDWRSPTYGQAGARNLPPINFGTRELLRGTQWEKFLNPVQAPVVPAPQTGMTYGDLVDVLQNRQGGTLTIGDIISGITSQYGQANPSAVG